MSLTLKFEHPHFPPDYEFGLNDLGVVKNGGSIEVDEDQERQFIASQGKSIEDAFAENSMVTLSGSSSISTNELKSLLPPPEPVEEEETTTVTEPPAPSVVEQENGGQEDGEVNA